MLLSSPVDLFSLSLVMQDNILKYIFIFRFGQFKQLFKKKIVQFRNLNLLVQIHLMLRNKSGNGIK